MINNSKAANEETANDIVNEIKKIRINNALSGANKKLKIEFLDNFNIIEEYMSSKKYNGIANILKKSNIEVVSNKNIIFSFKNNFDAVLFEKNNIEIDEFITKVFKNEYKTTAVTNEEWKKIKEKYIAKVKNGFTYSYIDEKKINSKKNNNTELEKKLNDIFGEKYITVE